MPNSSKKMIIIYILNILKKYTDESHSLTQKEIQDYLLSEYDMNSDRKTVRRNLSDLIDAGFPIEFREIPRSSGSSDEDDENIQYTDFRIIPEFTEGELRLLTDGIVFSRNIPVRQRRDLIDKLESLSSKYFKSNAHNILTAQTEGSAGKELFLNIETINEAISENLRLEFNYLEYHTDKKLYKRITKNNKVRRFTVSPYHIAAINGRYYMICNNDWFGDGLSHFRIDRITNLHLTNERRRPASEIPALKKSFSLSKHMTEHVYMFSDDAERISFRLNKALLNELFDWFDGSNLRFSDETDTEVTVSLTCSPEAMKLWATQFSQYVTILAPESLAKQVYQTLSDASARYAERLRIGTDN